MTSTKIQNELDYEKVFNSYGSYQYHITYQRTGNPDVAGPVTTGGTTTTFDFTPSVVNHAQSFLSYTLTPPAAVANTQRCFNVDTLSEIRSIRLSTRSGLDLVNIENFNKYLHMVLRHETKIEELLTNNKTVHDGMWEGLYSSQNTIALTSGAITSANGILQRQGAGTTLKSHLDSAVQICSGGTNVVEPVIKRRIPMSLFKNTILAMDKNIILGKETYSLTITWESAAKTFFSTTVAQTSLNGAAYAPGTSYSISNVFFYLAQETNADIINQIINKTTTSGINLAIPVVVSDNVATTGNNPKIMKTYTRNDGELLKKIYYSAYHSADTGRLAYDNSNINSATLGKIREFSTNINGKRNCPYNLVISNIDDYMLRAKKIKGSAYIDVEDYYRNWVFVEDFTDNQPMIDKNVQRSDENVIEGINLSSDQKYTIDILSIGSNASPDIGGDDGGDTKLNLNHYMFAITQKRLTINNLGITLM